MRRLLTLTAGHLAYRTIKPRWFSAHSFTAFGRLSQANSKQLQSKYQRHSTFLSRRIPIKQSIRYCSCQRIMCRGDADHPGGSMDITNARVLLPTNVKPIHYYLSLEPDFETFTFEGTVVIDLEVTEETDSISLNSFELEIHSTTISNGGVEIASAIRTSYDESDQVTTVFFDKSIPARSKAQLTQKFTGYLNDQMAGFYRSSYKDLDGTTKYLAVTQMEPADARRAFPCFDEPALKAEYTVTLIADKNHTCLSNMDQALEEEVDSKITGGKRKSVTFNRSPLMSTYLLCFIIGEFNCIETKNFRLPIRVFATPDKNIEHGRFSLELAAKTLEFYEKIFDSKFPLPKMDMVSIPDFSAGAMENWGLITYRVVDLLFDGKTSGAATKQRVAEVVQHELAHQWFGNLVTMDFWDGLWLNEGFATWMSWYACDHFFPEWKIWESYVKGDFQSALSLDSLRSSHPVEVPIQRADEVNQIFDAISYAKGSCVLQMISKYLGEEIFMEGIRRYLKKHAYGNTQTGDLWAALGEVSGKPVQQVMQIWTKNVGYPVVTVTETEGSDTIKLRQNRFLRTADVTPEDDRTLFPVFLGLRTKGGVDRALTLSTREQEFKIPSDGFFKLNADHAGLYRTLYSPERLDKLGQAAQHGLLSVEDRAGMIADAGALASSGYQKTSGLLTLLKSFEDEEEYVVWSEILNRLVNLRYAWVFEDPKTRDALKTFQLSLVGSKARAIGWSFTENEDHVQAQYKSLLFSAAGAAGDEKVIQAAQSMFRAFAAGDRTAIHPNIRSSVFGIVLEHGGETEYDIVLNEYCTATTADERNTALRCLGQTKDEKLMQRTLTLPLSDIVKSQDFYYPLSGLRTDTRGIEILWTWLQENWDAVVAKCPPGLSMFSSVVKVCTMGFSRTEQLEDVEQFCAGKDQKGFDRALQQSLDSVRAKAKWVDRDGRDVEAWLKSNGLLDDQARELLGVEEETLTRGSELYADVI